MHYELIDFQLTLPKAFETSLSALRMPALLNPLVSPCMVIVALNNLSCRALAFFQNKFKIPLLLIMNLNKSNFLLLSNKRINLRRIQNLKL